MPRRKETTKQQTGGTCGKKRSLVAVILKRDASGIGNVG
jgi:hypothetical protein